MRETYSGFLALDGGVLIGLSLGEKDFTSLEESLLSEETIGLTHELAITELLYILCRKTSMEIALEKLNYLKLSGYIEIINISELIEMASELKCKRALALADCFTIALAKKYSGKAVFAKLENEIKKEITKEPFDIDIVFIIDNMIVRKGERILNSLNI